jgi:hypothetical protein
MCLSKLVTLTLASLLVLNSSVGWPEHPPPDYVPKQPGHYTAEDWRDAIDSTCGPGLFPAIHTSIITGL